MTYIIKLRRGLAADWTAVNPTLADGEAGYEGDTGHMKLGDGSTPWNALPYLVDAVVGPEGPQGDQGEQGIPGTPGAAGGAGGFVIPAFIEGEIAAVVGDQRFYNPAGVALVIQAVSVGQSIGPSGGPNIYDLNVNGTTVFTDQSHRPTIAIGDHEATVGAIDAPAWPVHGYISWDVDLIGTTSPGSLATLTVLAVAA